MNLEILEFYPLEKNDQKETLTGTLRIRLMDFGIEILGIFVRKCQDKWYFNLPSRKGIHHETGQPVCYPTIGFTDRDKQRELIDAIRERGRVFIEKRLVDKEKPLIFPQVQQEGLGRPEAPRAQERPSAPKETAAIAKPKPSPIIASKVWMDPPPRSIKPTARYMTKFGR